MGIARENFSLDELFISLQNRFSDEAFGLICKAYDVAEKFHRPQKRKSGEPYIIHPINVAYILNELGVDEKVISAGLLHDVIEDTEYTEENMVSDFGEEITKLVIGVTKISKIKKESISKSEKAQEQKKRSKETELARNLMKILLASVNDIRVLIIKLSDKTHNMRTIKYQSLEKRQMICKEVMELYAPIAGRLGIYRIKSELEDLSFRVLYPEEYQEIKTRVNSKKSEREIYIERIKQILITRLKEVNIKATVNGRAKHFYSIYSKMTQKGRDFEKIYDLRAIRIITEEERDCYGVLGFVHSLWNPIPGRFKDYIANPKSNLYQSLHTSVMGPDGKGIEIQIRTRAMHETAEYGIAAHWAYKESQIRSELNVANTWSEKIKSLSESIFDPQEFVNEFSSEIREDEIIVFTPSGDAITMPKCSTVLDFAFRIHTDIGLHARGAKVDDKIVSLRKELRSGNQIEIITDKKTKPSPIWLRIVKTSTGRHKLRQYFKVAQDDINSQLAQSVSKNPLVEKELANIQKQKSSKKASDKKEKKTKEIKVIVAGIKDILVKLSGCCSPLPGDEIIGFITKGRGVSV